MSCAVATTWMLPHDEYYTQTEDYALVGESAKLIRAEIDQANNFVPAPRSKILYYNDLLRLQRDGSAYDFACAGNHMIFADVDDRNPNHEWNIKRLRSKEEKIKDDWDHRYAKTAEAQEALVIHLVEVWKAQVLSHTAKDAPFPKEACETETPSSVEEMQLPHVELQAMFYEWKKVEAIEYIESMAEQRQTPDSVILNYIFGAGHEYREELMHIFSGQALSPSRRPVMLLIDIFDSRQSSMPGVKSGWTLAYDVCKSQIIIKAFFSDKVHHPLTSSWSDPIVEDGVSCILSPLELIKAYHSLAQNITNGHVDRIHGLGEGGTNFDSENSFLAFRMLVHTLAVKWVLRHWSGLIRYWCKNREESATLLKCTKVACKNIKAYLRLIPFPEIAKTKTVQWERKTVVHPFAELEWALEEMEDYFRWSAVGAQEVGEGKIAVNVAVLYEKLVGMVKAFNADPRMDMSAREVGEEKAVGHVVGL